MSALSTRDGLADPDAPASPGCLLTPDERELARAARHRFAAEPLNHAELASEIDRWRQHRALLAGDLAHRDDPALDAATIAAGIAYADIRLAELAHQARRLLRVGPAGGRPDTASRPDFARARFADLVGLAATLTGEAPAPASRGRWRMRCPFHDDSTPSLVIYMPGQGWHCFGCGRGGQDAASFCAEYFVCSQHEGLRWVEQLCDLPDGVRGGTAGGPA